MLLEGSQRATNSARTRDVDDDCSNLDANLAEVAAKHGCTGVPQKGRSSDLIKISQDLHANQVRLTEARGGGDRVGGCNGKQ